MIDNQDALFFRCQARVGSGKTAIEDQNAQFLQATGERWHTKHRLSLHKF
jgi:hypothetical protein